MMSWLLICLIKLRIMEDFFNISIPVHNMSLSFTNKLIKA